MKTLLNYTLLLILLVSCSSSSVQNIVEGPVIVEGKKMPDFTFTDQFDNTKKIDSKTETLFFAFNEEPAHAVNDFLADKKATFLKDNATIFIADVSAAPGIIQKMFILPGIKKFDYPVYIFTDEEEAKPFREGVKIDKIIVVQLENNTIKSIQELNATVEAVKTYFEK